MILKYNQTKSNNFAHTYSIIARDPKTGEMGVGVQSHWFSVGSLVSWGEAGIGVVATQSLVNKSFGLRGLDLLKQGNTPQEAIDILLSDDDGRDVRQVAILDIFEPGVEIHREEAWRMAEGLFKNRAEWEKELKKLIEEGTLHEPSGETLKRVEP